MYLFLNIALLIIATIFMMTERYIVKGQRKYIFFVMIVLSALLFALRPETTKDTQVYIDKYAQNMDVSSINVTIMQKYQGMEIGYWYLMHYFRIISKNYRVFFFFISFVGLLLTLVALNGMTEYAMEDNYDQSSGNSAFDNRDMCYGTILALYLSGWGMLYNGISMRVGIAMGLGLIAITYALHKKTIKAIIMFGFAFLLQRSSFLLVTIYLIIKFFPKIARKKHFIIWGLCGFLLLSGLSRLFLSAIITLLQSIIIQLGISGFGAYLVELYPDIGLRDIFCWLLYGLMILISDNSTTSQKYLNVVMSGTIIVVFLYAVRAVARAYDMFFLFTIPILYMYYNYGLEHGSVLKKFYRVIPPIMCVMNGILMLRTCFL